MAKSNNGGVYANMDFGSYVYQEYPKHIKTDKFGNYITVSDSTEEKKVRSELQYSDQEAATEVVAQILEDPHHEALVAKCRVLGVPFNPKWSNSKLQATITANETSNDDLPPEENTEDAVEDKDALIAKAKSFGIPATKLWGVPRLLREIEVAEANKE